MRMIRRVALACVFAALAGCAIGKPMPSVSTYVIELPIDTQERAQSPRGETLRVGKVRVAAAYGGETLVYRLDDVRYEADPYHAFIADSGSMFAGRIAQWLDRAGLFTSVTQPETIRPARYLLEATVVELYGDFRPGRNPAAVMAVQFALLDQSTPRLTVVHECTMASRIDLAQASPDELVRGYGKALADILSRLVVELSAEPAPVHGRAAEAAAERRPAPALSAATTDVSLPRRVE
jgi:cholesterol transport system auxiliary component